MDNKQLIQEFINWTPKWLEQMAKMKQDDGCAICGIRPENIKKLLAAIIELKDRAYRYDQLKEVRKNY